MTRNSTRIPHKRSHRNSFLIVGSALAMMVATQSQAQDTGRADTSSEDRSTGGLEEITVTARRTEESLNTVPLSVTAFSEAAIRDKDLSNLTDLSRNTPGFQFTNQVGGGSGRSDRSVSTNLTFRGLYIPDLRAVATGGGIFVNGAPVIGAGAPAMADIERVEVLKGPQSVYFGRATFAGAINYVTKKPSYEFGGRAEAEVGNYGSYMFGAMLNVPIVQDVLAVRLSAQRDFEGGQYTNFAERNQTLGDRKTTSINGEVLFEPTSTLEFRAYGSYTEFDDGPAPTASLKQGELNCDLGGTRGKWYCGTVPGTIPANLISGNFALNSYSQPVVVDNSRGFYDVLPAGFLDHAGLRRTQLQLHLHGAWQFGDGFELSSITAFHKDRSAAIFDAGMRDARGLTNPIAATNPNAPPFPWWLLNSQGKSRDFSQEIRLTSPQDKRLRYTVGASYFEADLYSFAVFGISSFGPTYAAPLTRTWPKTPAVFGGIYFDVLPSLTVSAEGRYQWDKVRSQLLVNGSGVVQNLTPATGTFKSFSPRVTVDWNFAPDSTLYALWARGTRPGGFNTQVSGLTAADIAYIVNTGGIEPTFAFGEERLTNMEAGVKHRFLNNRANIALTIYSEKLRDGQNTNQAAFTDAAGLPKSISYTVNAGEIDLKGIEFEGQLAPIDGLTLTSTFALNDTKFKSWICADCTLIAAPAAGQTTPSIVGNRVMGAPKYTWNLGAAYEAALTSDFDWFARVDYSHRGSFYLDNLNLAKTKSDDQVNVRFGIKSDAWRLEAFATNLFNEKTIYGQSGVDVLNQISRYGITTYANEMRLSLPDKRRLGLRASYSF